MVLALQIIIISELSYIPLVSESRYATVFSKYLNELHMKMVQHVSLVIFSLVRQGGVGLQMQKNFHPSTNST